MRLRTLLVLGLISNLPTVWSNVLCGLVLAGAEPTPLRLWLLLPSLSCSYVGGMFLNDAFDRELDRRQRPERPIPSGQIAAAHVFAIGYGLLAVGLGLLVALALLQGSGGWAVASGAALAGCIVLYDAWHKNNPLSPLLMGLCRVAVYVTAALAAGAGFGATLAAGSAALLAWLIGLSAVAKQETRSRVEQLWPLLALALPLLWVVWLSRGGPLPLLLAAALAAWAVRCVRLVRAGGPSIGRAVAALIAGIALLDAAQVAALSPGWPVGACLLAFGAALLAQRFVPAT